MSEGNLLTLERLKAQARVKRRRMTVAERAADDRKKEQFLNRRLPRFEAMLNRCSVNPVATAARRERKRTRGQTGCQARARSVRHHAPGRTRNSRRAASRSSGSSDDPGGESEPPGLGNTGRRAYSRKLSGVVA